jgi:hypothetical protein
MKALIRAQVYDTLQDAGVFDKIDDDLRTVLRPFVKVSSDLANQDYDRRQANLNRYLKNFDSDDVGLFRLIPKEKRKVFSGLAKAVADPINQLGDRIQNATNKVVKEFPQTEAATE